MKQDEEPPGTTCRGDGGHGAVVPSPGRAPRVAERVLAPGADEIESRFRSRRVRIVRPLVLAATGVLRLVRGYDWSPLGLEHLTEVDGPVLLASNHASHADTAAILGVLPPHLRERTCVAAALDVFGPVNGARCFSRAALRREAVQLFVAAAYRAFGFDRHGPPLRSLRTASQLVQRGWSLLLYPEGTRSRNGEVGQFKPGVAVLARLTGAAVIPIFVNGGRDILPPGSRLPRRAHAVVVFGHPMRIHEGESAEAFTHRVRDQVRRLERTARAGRRVIDRRPPRRTRVAAMLRRAVPALLHSQRGE